MKVVAFALLLAFPAKSQTAWEKGTYVLLASAIYTAYDYAVYAPNQWRAGTVEATVYRITQVGILVGLVYFLHQKFGWKTAASFGALYVSWCFDAAYYWMYGKDSWDEVERGEVVWAKHTPAGWFETPTSAKTLKKQMAIGITVSIALLL